MGYVITGKSFIDEKLNFEKYISKICRKVSQQIAVLKGCRKSCLLRLERIFTKLLFYHTLITAPKLGTSVIRSQLTSWRWSTNKHPILFLSNRCLMRDFVSDWSQSLCEQWLEKILSTVFKIFISHAGPASLWELITVRCSTCNLGGTTILDLPKVKSTTSA